MKRSLVRSVYVHLTFCTIAAGRIASMSCRDCQTALDIHQPDPGLPDQFLGTCPECGTWYRIESRVDSAMATVIRLPVASEILPPDPPGEVTA